MSWPLLTLGLLMIGLGVVAPGTQPKAVTALILAGSSLSAIAVLHPIYREFEIGLTKLRFARRDTGVPDPWMIAEAETLTGIARWALGDSDHARTIVEDALTMVRRVNRRIPPSEREVMKLKTLVALLHKADQRRMLSGDGRAGDVSNGTMAALQAVDFEARIAFALCSEFRVKEVAGVLDSSEEEVAAQIQRARDIVRLNAPVDGSPG